MTKKDEYVYYETFGRGEPMIGKSFIYDQDLDYYNATEPTH